MRLRLPVQIIDPKLKQNFRPYVLQCLLLVGALLLVLSLEGAHLSKVVVIAAIGSTAFVLFVTPRSATAAPRHVIGGHLICLAVGGSFAAFDATGTGQRLLATAPILFDAEAALAVGLGMFLMAATNTEHAPAAGTALGMVVHGFSWGLVAFVATSVVILSLIHTLLRSRLRDLL